MSKSNRFEEDNKDLVIDNQKFESAADALSVVEFESIGQDQCNSWRKSVLDAKKRLLTALIKQNCSSMKKCQEEGSNYYNENAALQR